MKKIILIVLLIFFSVNHKIVAQIVTNNDSVNFFNGSIESGDTNIFANDTYNGSPINPADFDINIISCPCNLSPSLGCGNCPSPVCPVLISSDGYISYIQGEQYRCGGEFTLTYQICERVPPYDCAQGSLQVLSYATHYNSSDTFYVDIIDGVVNYLLPPFTSFANVLNNDDFCNSPYQPNTFVPGGVALPAGISMDSGGNITVDPSVSTGIYYFEYDSHPAGSGPTTVRIEVFNNQGLNSTMIGTYNDFNNDGYVSIGDVIDYSFTVTNSSTDTFTNVSFSSPTLNINGSPISLLGGSTDTSSFTARYVLTETDNITGGIIYNTATLNGLKNNTTSVSIDVNESTTLGITDAIKLIAFKDLNNNGVKDSTDEIFYQGQFQYERNNDGVLHNLSSFGITPILYEINPANSYNLNFSIPSSLAAYYTLSGTNSYTNVQVAQGSGVTIYYFPVTEIPFEDISVNSFSIGNLRPGTSTDIVLSYRNNGTNNISSGTITYTHSPNVSITLPAGATAIPNGFTYNFTNLARHQTKYLYVSMAVPTLPTVALGDLVTNNVSITPPTGDINSSNNSFNFTNVIRGSYDPNDKTESHGGEIEYSTFTTDDYLTYTIRFENTGTDNAINIKVADVLDSQLDPTSIKMIDASAPYVLERIDNNVTWKFDGINLPPSVTDSEIGKGYIIFQIKPNPGYAVNDIIPNSANIYFDTNPAIVTDICQTKFVDTMGANTFLKDNITAYPNPTHDFVTLDKEVESVKVYTILGQQIFPETKVMATQTQIDFSNFPTGVYLIETIKDGAKATSKIIKE